MTTATLTFGSQYHIGRSSVSGGVSEVARQSVSKFKQGVLDKLRTASWQGSIITTLPALAASYKEAEAQAQFEDQALPSAGALKEAQELLEALPHWCAAPVPTIEPSGAIAFESGDDRKTPAARTDQDSHVRFARRAEKTHGRLAGQTRGLLEIHSQARQKRQSLLAAGD